MVIAPPTIKVSTLIYQDMKKIIKRTIQVFILFSAILAYTIYAENRASEQASEIIEAYALYDTDPFVINHTIASIGVTNSVVKWHIINQLNNR